ncbi:MAG: hypothetical protein KJO06_08280 [Gemmatimonadetes bacterium]|nr:hypothetical protein [Gemmatimonadota bacterium]
MIRRALDVARRPVWILLFAISSGGAAELRGQELFPAWVAMYGSAPVARLSNEYRIAEVCTESATMEDCYREQMAPSLVSMPLHAGPSDGASVVGEILLVVTPGRGLSAFYRAAALSVAPVYFMPDVFMGDWGYGYYFHQTIADRSGDWFKLPRGPWPTPVWLRVPPDTEGERVMAVRGGDIIEMEGSGWYVVSSSQDYLLLRPEQPGDMWCAEGDPPGFEKSNRPVFSGSIFWIPTVIS